ncbi:transposase family protein [Dactylosporangium cerinum]|uniref:Transposase family protein n=1 Tax=Dactylosporangium cerinum TaxID=1434730 RepID=A0ABV9VKV8_9ACTN
MGRLLPHLGSIRINEITEASGGVVLHAASRSAEQSCPACSVVSGRVHSRYQRWLADLPAVGRLVELCLTVRRFFCVNTVCGTRTFAESLPREHPRQPTKHERSQGASCTLRSTKVHTTHRRSITLHGTEPTSGARCR